MMRCWKIKVPQNISLKCVSSQISGVRSFLCALSIFGISEIPTHRLKEALVTWPLSASGLFLLSYIKLSTQRAKGVTRLIFSWGNPSWLGGKKCSSSGRRKVQGDRFCMARDVYQDEIYTKKSRVGITLGIYKLSGLGTLIKRQMSFSYL